MNREVRTLSCEMDEGANADGKMTEVSSSLSLVGPASVGGGECISNKVVMARFVFECDVVVIESEVPMENAPTVEDIVRKVLVASKNM